MDVVDYSRQITAHNDADEMSVEEFVAAFQRIRDAEVRASLIALITRLAENSTENRPRLQS